METINKYINLFRISKLWGRTNINWNNVNEDVNILVGINGCGKTALLNLISDFYSGQKIPKSLAADVCGNKIDSKVTYIRSFDVPANAKKKTESMLLQELKHIINQNGEGTSFFDYRMKMLNYPNEAETIRQRIEKFFMLVNRMFAETGKEIRIDPKNNKLVFSLYNSDNDRLATYGNKGGTQLSEAGTDIQLEQLSSGEKQLMLILTTVFLQEEKPSVLLMDEPEISLHISWQDCLIELIRNLNPNCQLIITTHAPNIFANGWEDKIVFVKDLEEK